MYHEVSFLLSFNFLWHGINLLLFTVDAVHKKIKDREKRRKAFHCHSLTHTNWRVTVRVAVNAFPFSLFLFTGATIIKVSCPCVAPCKKIEKKKTSSQSLNRKLSGALRIAVHSLWAGYVSVSAGLNVHRLGLPAPLTYTHKDMGHKGSGDPLHFGGPCLCEMISTLRLRRAVYRRVGVSTELISFLFLLLATTDKEQRNLASK